ncbi:DUF1405 domain-containing protein [Paenibacillus sp. GCM10023252]|uniref:DUF1405 domain-containing protein n=1 Tax=Paenibacillus sp. GCM10023252 TaxID=3252649 RepID=UPI00361C55AB
MQLSWLWSRTLLLSRRMLWLLFFVNAAGTIYGYIWYGNQLEYTMNHHPLWQLVFVPDSPTASLFFTLSLLYLLFPPRQPSALGLAFRSLLEALAVVTSVKYGIWAVAMIIGGAMQGDTMVWQDYMLIVSHLAMALEVLLYIRFMKIGPIAVTMAGVWLLLNDIVDYRFGVFPWLPEELMDDLTEVQTFTIGLSLFSLFCARAALILVKRSGRGQQQV